MADDDTKVMGLDDVLAGVYSPVTPTTPPPPLASSATTSDTNAAPATPDAPVVSPEPVTPGAAPAPEPTAPAGYNPPAGLTAPTNAADVAAQTAQPEPMKPSDIKEPPKVTKDPEFLHALHELQAAPDLTPHLPPIPEGPKMSQSTPPSLLDQMTRGIGKFGQGFLGGAGEVDQETVALAKALHLPSQQGEEATAREAAERESALTPGAKDDPLYQAGSVAGKAIQYAENAIPIGLAAAAAPFAVPAGGTAATIAATGAGLAGGALQGAVDAGGQSARAQGLLKGGVDKGQLAQDAGIGAGFGLAGGLAGKALGHAFGEAGKAIGKRFDQMAEGKAIKEGLGKVGKMAADETKDAGKALENFRARVSDELRKHETEMLDNLHKRFNVPPPAENAFQQAQRAALAKEGERGPFRLRMFEEGGENKRGFDLIPSGKTLQELDKMLPMDVHKALTAAVDAIGQAKALKEHLKNEVEAAAKNALNLAKTAAQKAQIEIEEKLRLNHQAASELAKKKSELFTKQEQEQAQKLTEERAKLQDEFKTAHKGLKAQLTKQIGELDEALKRMSEPHSLHSIPTDKRLYGIANRRELENDGRELAKTYKKAYDQFVKHSGELKAAEKQYDALKTHFMDALHAAEKAYQEHVGNSEERLFVKHQITNPFAKDKATTFALGLVHKPFIARLNAMYQTELKQMESELMAQEENVVKELAYKVGGVEKLTKQSGKDAHAILQQMGALHPVAEKLALAAAFGLTALDAPAQAHDGKPPGPNERDHWLRNAGFTLAAAVLAGKFGPAAARNLTRFPAYYFARYWANTRDLAEFADKAMKINPLTHPDSSMAHNMSALAGRVISAVVKAPDDHIYLLKAVREEVDQKLLSPIGKKYATEIRDAAKAFQSFAQNYAGEWHKHYGSLPEQTKKDLEPIDEAIHFIAHSFTDSKRGNLADKAFAGLAGHAAKAWFTLNPKQWMAGVADIAMSGPLQVGPAAIARAELAYTTNPVLRGLANRMVIGSQGTEAIQGMAPKVNPLLTEVMQNRIMGLASLSHYFHTNPRTMRAIGASTEEDFIKRTLTGKLAQDIDADVFIQMSRDLADTTGGDPLALTRGVIGRSRVGNFLKFVSQPERFARLMMTNVSKGNIPWIVASVGATWQFAGHASIPVSLRMAGYAFRPEDTAKLMSALDMSSAGQRVLGTMSNVVDWDPFLYPAMGAIAPGFDTIINTVNDVPKFAAQIDEVIHAASQGGRAFLGDKADAANQKAQYALYGILNDIALAIPMMGPVPTRMVGNFQYHLPEVIHGDYRLPGAPNPIYLGHAPARETPRMITGGLAKEAAARAMLGLPPPGRVQLYNDIHGVPQSDQYPGLRQLENALHLGIPPKPVKLDL